MSLAGLLDASHGLETEEKAVSLSFGWRVKVEGQDCKSLRQAGSRMSHGGVLCGALNRKVSLERAELL